jgi:hypothetical protein
MKFLFSVAFLLVLTCFVLPQQAFAHRERMDGVMTGKLHIDPDDDPFIGQEAHLHFHIENELHTFMPENCACVMTIESNGEVLMTQELTQIANMPISDIHEQFSTTFTFPGAGQYFVKLSGQPKDGVAFDPFLLNFDMLVEREGTQGVQGTASVAAESTTAESTQVVIENDLGFTLDAGKVGLLGGSALFGLFGLVFVINYLR